MQQMRSSQSAHDVAFSCPHCGARYVVSYTELPIAHSGSDYCECCKRRMVQWNSALRPYYRLVERPDRNHP
jgi:transcription elongation factor Elf1